MNETMFFYLYSLAHQSVFLDWLIIFCANVLGNITIVVVAIFLIFHKDGKFNYKIPFHQLKNKIKEISLVFSVSFLSWIIANILKHYIFSPRPFMFFEKVHPLFVHGGLDSFPSGHAMFFSALATSVFFIHKRVGFLLFVVALIVSLARVASGIHFPLDIFAGWILGLGIALLFNIIFRKICG